MRRWAKFRSLSWPEKWLLIRIALLMPWIGGSLRLAGFRTTQARLSRFIPSTPIRDHFSPVSLSNVVNGAGLVLGPGSCLRRALVLWWLLRRRGYAPIIQYGVRRDRTCPPSGSRRAQSLAHAWVELDGAVLNDVADVATHCAILERPVVNGHERATVS